MGDRPSLDQYQKASPRALPVSRTSGLDRGRAPSRASHIFKMRTRRPSTQTKKLSLISVTRKMATQTATRSILKLVNPSHCGESLLQDIGHPLTSLYCADPTLREAILKSTMMEAASAKSSTLKPRISPWALPAFPPVPLAFCSIF